MVRIVSVSALGYGDYGATFSDREVDGIEYEDIKEKPDVIQKPSKQPPKAQKLKGGRKSG